jgi:hypothetical protein
MLGREEPSSERDEGEHVLDLPPVEDGLPEPVVYVPKPAPEAVTVQGRSVRPRRRGSDRVLWTLVLAQAAGGTVLILATANTGTLAALLGFGGLMLGLLAGLRLLWFMLEDTEARGASPWWVLLVGGSVLGFLAWLLWRRWHPRLHEPG